MTFKTKGRQGNNVKRISVSSNDPAQPQVNLSIKAQVETVLGFEPKYINFGTADRKKGATLTAKLVGRDAASTKIVSAKFVTEPGAASGGPDALVTTQIPGGDQAGTVTLSLAPSAPAGIFTGSLVVRTDHPKVPELTLKVRGNVQGSVRFQPQRVHFRVVDPSAVQTVTLELHGAGGVPVEVLGVSTDHPSLTASFSETEDGQPRVSVTCDGNVHRARETATLLIKTSSSEDPEIRVPVDLYRVTNPPRRPKVSPPSKRGKPTQR